MNAPEPRVIDGGLLRFMTAGSVDDGKSCWLSPQPFARDGSYLLKHTTRTLAVAAVDLVQHIEVETFERTAWPQGLRMNQLAQVQIHLRQPILVDAYAHDRVTGSFILIDAATNDTLAAGIVL